MDRLKVDLNLLQIKLIAEEYRDRFDEKKPTCKVITELVLEDIEFRIKNIREQFQS